MAYTTHEKIRVETGFQERYVREQVINKSQINGTQTKFYVQGDSYTKIVPEFASGTTIAGVSDIQVWGGLSGISGATRYAIFAVDPDEGSFTLVQAPASGSSLTVTYAQSAIPSRDVEDARVQAEAQINQKLSLAYSVPVGATCSTLTDLATRLAAAKILLKNYGGRATSDIGYALYEQIMGKNQTIMGKNTSNIIEIGELGMLTLPGYQLTDDNGNIIPRIDINDIAGSTSYTANGTIAGRLYDIKDENFRFVSSRYDTNNNYSGNGTGFWGA